MAPDKFVEQLNIAEAAADVTMRDFMNNHLRKYHACQLTTNQKLVAAGVMVGVAAVAAAATPQGREAIRGTTTKVRCKIARFFAPKEVNNVHPEDPSVDFVDVVAN
jgi:hypothetical protein